VRSRHWSRFAGPERVNGTWRLFFRPRSVPGVPVAGCGVVGLSGQVSPAGRDGLEWAPGRRERRDPMGWPYPRIMRVSVCQPNAREDRADNLAVARDLLGRAAAAGAEFAVLPEYVDYLGPGRTAPKPEPIDGEFAAFFSDAARELGIWVHAGSFHEVGPDETRTYNTTLLFDPAGERVAVYRKIHLYDVEIAGRVSYQESRSVAPGSETVVTAVNGVPTGLSICYDLRFPELYRRLAIAGAKILVVPAAFMMHTGRDHWEVLLRARAIENQCYVVAAGTDRRSRARAYVLRAQHDHRPLGDRAGSGAGHRGDRHRGSGSRAPGHHPRRAAQPGEPSSVASDLLKQVADDRQADDGAADDQHRAAHPGRSAHEQAVHRDDQRDQHQNADQHLPEGHEQTEQRVRRPYGLRTHPPTLARRDSTGHRGFAFRGPRRVVFSLPEGNPDEGDTSDGGPWGGAMLVAVPGEAGARRETGFAPAEPTG
jgi:deaminated glutathione amidase